WEPAVVRGLRLVCAGISAVAGVGCTAAPSRPAAIHRTPPPASTKPSSDFRSVPAGMQRAWLHGVGVDAPASWPRNAVHCGRAIRDTFVVFPSGGGNQSCAIWPIPDVSTVWLGAYD